jgi:hypothetical protein
LERIARSGGTPKVCNTKGVPPDAPKSVDLIVTVQNPLDNLTQVVIKRGGLYSLIFDILSHGDV